LNAVAQIEKTFQAQHEGWGSKHADYPEKKRFAPSENSVDRKRGGKKKRGI